MAGAAGDIVEWAVGAGLNELSQSDLIAGYCERLVEAGVPLWRASIGADTLHPLIDAQGHRWLQGEGIREEFIFRASAPAREDEWRRSPWYRMLETKEEVMRRRLAAGEGTNEFPLLANLAAQGATDYWARIVGFGDRGRIGETHGLATSWASRDPGGFRRGRFGTARGDAAGLGPGVQGDHGHRYVARACDDVSRAGCGRANFARRGRAGPGQDSPAGALVQ